MKEAPLVKRDQTPPITGRPREGEFADKKEGRAGASSPLVTARRTGDADAGFAFSTQDRERIPF